MPSYLPKDAFPSWQSLDQEECLIVEELCRVIATARRFQTCTEAWSAIQNVRRIREQIRKDSDFSSGTVCEASDA